MCGIVAYIGDKDVCPLLIEGLKRLDYRGYDSAGVVVIRNGQLHIRRAAGRISALEQKLDGSLDGARIGIAHYALGHAPGSHGEQRAPAPRQQWPAGPSPQRIIENFRVLRQYLEDRGVEMRSDTDSEVLAQLIGHFYDDSLEKAVRQALREVRGTFGIAVIHADEPDVIVAAGVAAR